MQDSNPTFVSGVEEPDTHFVTLKIVNVILDKCETSFFNQLKSSVKKLISLSMLSNPLEKESKRSNKKPQNQRINPISKTQSLSKLNLIKDLSL